MKTDNNTISYPCTWTYSVIGSDLEALYEAIDSIMPHEYQANHGLESKGKKYISLRIDIEVHTQEMRDNIFQSLSRHEAIKMVL